MKILVTGDKGFIGSALVKRLQTEKHEVVGIDTKAEANILTANLPEVDLVIHLAGIGGVRESMNDPKKYWDNPEKPPRLGGAGTRYAGCKCI